MKTNWRTLIGVRLKDDGAQWSDIEAITLTEEELNAEFDDGYGGSEGKPFTAWTKDRVYFPAVYDGNEWAWSVPRNPCDVATCHVGGE